MQAISQEQIADSQGHGGEKPGPKPIQIFVNNNPVLMKTKEATGRQIKEAAIEQGVKIEIDFVLFEDHGNGKQEIVADNQPVKLHEHQRFEAVCNDDHS